MGTNISYGGPNSGLQIGENRGHITAQFVQPEASLNQACLRDLRTTSPHDDKDRIEQTNGGLLIDSYRWILDNEQFRQWQDNQSSRLLWIKGDPGKGKTMLLCGIIDELTRVIGATDVRLNNATAVLRGLIYSLVQKQPSLLSHVRSQYDQAGKTLFEDVNAWNALSKVFNNIMNDQTLQNTYLVIDALDECTTDLPLLLDLVVQESSTHSHVKWIVSSRNWPGIQERLDTATETAPISLELNETSVSNAVRQFIRYKVYQLAEVKKYKDEIRDAVYRHLSLHSQGTFLWVALVCQDLNRTSRRHVLKKLKEFPPGLDALYGRMIDQVRTSEDAEACKRILAVMSIAYRPITLAELTALVEIPDGLSDDDEALLEIIAICGSFLTCREDVIVFVHQSAKEFLLEKARIEVFPEGHEAEHLAMFSRSLQTMLKTLRHNILDIKLVGISTEEFTQPRSNPLAAVKYACFYDRNIFTGLKASAFWDAYQKE
ncbi:Vegetative incompatibility protein HET-E-1 [Penicillium subrubescens]|uniref:Vegetative incompatibility protein HET-E-1 n=1 Tax=Penicillium subrubescens TaxID=1316194 RepID=A0A1Q5TBP4_9EURO|nr:Vegetative incompatibility protein HET-E-1 [Penicillium subrubescens]